ncbi:hypothetical protein EDD11_005103 [Mortierella claussenii]|nr:hypothetical protein EDD11_005103 [Mortierella claussenii]
MDDERPFDRVPYARNESRVPSAKSRRATGESVNRPKPGHSRGGSTVGKSTMNISSVSAPSTPRPIPKSGNNKKGPQPTSMSSSYTFDETIDNPFLPSTPPAFTPSMERTGFFKAPSTETKNAVNSFNALTTSTKAAAAKTRSDAVVRNTSEPAVVKTPFNPTLTRSRDASVSSVPGLSGLPGPRHEDMILPAVAKRIKEQGLHEHDVVAYSDDYNAPLYKVPGSSASIGNPFASYDRLKAASSTSLAQSKQDNFTAHNVSDSPLPPTPAIPATFASPSDQSDRDQTVPTSPNSNSTSRQQSPRQHETTSQEQQVPSSITGEPTTISTPESGSSGATKPERPRRARSNTNHQMQQEQQEQYEQYRPHRSRQPTMPGIEGHDQMRTDGRDRQHRDVEPSLPRSRRDQQQGYGHAADNNEYAPSSYRSGTRDRYQSNEPPAQNGSPHYNYQQNGISSRDQSRDRYEQQNSDSAQTRRYAGFEEQYQRSDANNGGRQERHEFSEQNNHYSRNQDDHYNHSLNSQGVQVHQQAYNGGQSGYSDRHNQYNSDQRGYYPQQQQNNYENGEVPHSQFPPQHESQSQRTPPRPEMVQVEMSDMSPVLKAGLDTDHAMVKDKDNMKKKGAVCCVIM